MLTGAGAGGNCGPDKVEWRARRAASAEAAVAGRALDVDSLTAALEQLQHDIDPGNTPGARPCLSIRSYVVHDPAAL